MIYIIALLQLWTLILLCTVVGRRIVNLLPTLMQRTVGLYIAPTLGLAFYVLVATLYGWLSPFNCFYSIPLVGLISIISILSEKRKLELCRHSGYVSLFTLICALPIMAPLLRYSGYNPFTDIFTYLAQSQWLQYHSFAEKVIISGNFPAFTQVALYQSTGSRMGGTFLLGFVQSLFAIKWSYSAYIPAVSLSFVTGCLAIGGIIRQIVPVKKNVVLALALLPGLLMNGFVFGAEWGFYPQTLGLSLAIGLCAIFPFLIFLMIRLEPNWKQLVIYAIPSAISTAAWLFAYNEPFPIFAAAIGLFFLITLNRHFAKRKTLFNYFLFYFIEVLILINYEAIRIVRNVYQTLTISDGNAPIGWPVLWSPIQFIAYAFGLKSPFDHSGKVDFILSTIIAPIALLLLFFILIKFMQRNPRRRMTLSFLFCIELLLLIFFLKFRYLSPNMSELEIGHTFLQYKIAKYAAPFSLALLGIFAALIWHYQVNYRACLKWIYGIIFVCGLIFHMLITSKHLTGHFLSSVKQTRAPFDVLLNLHRTAQKIPSDETIYVALGPQNSKLRQMVAYVLYEHKIASDYRDDGYILGNLPIQDRNMSADNADWLLFIGQNDTSQELFTLQKKPFHAAILEKQENDYGAEFNAQGQSWNWVKQAITFHYKLLGKMSAVQIKFTLEPYKEARSFQIELQDPSGHVLANYTLSNLSTPYAFESAWVKVNSIADLTVIVKASGEPQQLSMVDKRQASFKIMNVALESQG